MPQRNYFSLLFLFLFPLLSFSQEVNLDSLRHETEIMGNDTQSVRKLIRMAEKYRLFNLEGAIQSANAAYERTGSIGDKKLQCDVEFELGIIYEDKSDFIKATTYLTAAEKKAEESNYSFGLLRCLNSLGNCYALQKQSKIAVDYYKRALEICIRLKQNTKRGVILGNIGNLLYEKSDNDKSYLDSALVYYNLAYRQDSALQDTDRILTILNNRALVYGDKREFEKARKNLFEAKVYIDKTHNLDAKLNYYNYFGRLLSYERKWKEADLYFDSCLTLSKKIGSINMISEVYISKSDNAYEQRDYLKAYENLVIYKHISDSILNAENFATASDIQHKYEREKKQRELEKLQLRNQNQRIIITSVIVFFVGVVIFAFVLYRRLQINRRQKDIIEQQRNEMLDSIHYAKRIQTALLASENLLKENLAEYFIFYRPKDIVSGDFYWATRAEDKFIFCLGDCTGHGVPGAFMSLLNISKLNETINDYKIVKPDLVLNEIRKEIITALNPNGTEETNDGMDCTLCSFDFKSMTLEYAAANNPPLVIERNQSLNLKADKMPVGRSPRETQSFSLHSVKLEKGDTVYLFTDGYADQFGGPHGKKFKFKNLRTIIMANNHLPLHEQKNMLDKLFDEWKGDLEQIDDVAIVGIRIK